MSQQSSSTKKDKDAMEDKKRNPILKYIAKPKMSQSSEYWDIVELQGGLRWWRACNDMCVLWHMCARVL